MVETAGGRVGVAGINVNQMAFLYAGLVVCVFSWVLGRWPRIGWREWAAMAAGFSVVVALARTGSRGAAFALLLGLVLYTAAFVAEVVRAGIQAVSKGQREAAMAVGLRPNQVLQLVIIPQAMRVIIPPLTSQMLNLTKNSSLAVAIGFPDFVSVANTTMNQTGQSIEGVALIMLVYLIFSLSTSAFMNWYNKKVKLVER